MAYIPKQHEKYDLLPFRREHGGEVFDYPSKLINEIERIMGFSDMVFPYGYDSYEEYYASVDEVIKMHGDNAELVDLLKKLKLRIKQMNVKEDWSILRYVGEKDSRALSITPGGVYYWPTERSNPVYHGVVNDEEFTSYLYPTEASQWEILEDPTGMAYNTIYNRADGYLGIKDHNYILEQLANMAVEGEDKSDPSA